MSNDAKEKWKSIKGRYSQCLININQLDKCLSSNTFDNTIINLSHSSKDLPRYINNKDKIARISEKALTIEDKQQTILYEAHNGSSKSNGVIQLPLTSKSIKHRTSLPFLINKLPSIKNDSINQQLAHKFVRETILMGSKGLDKFKNYQQIRKKIIKDFQDNNTNDSIQSSR